MEEILASIRRIISEDDAPAETAAAAPTPEPEPEPEPEPAPEPAEDVLELTERYEAHAEEPAARDETPYVAPAEETLGDLDIGSADPFPVDDAAPEPEPEPEPAPAPPAASAPDEALVSDATAASAAGAFAGLAAALRPAPASASAPGGNSSTVDELVRGLLSPMLREMLKDWLDANLQGIVETEVRKEVDRVSRLNGAPR